ncbi:MAG: DNA replication/repair protein RecF [Clostridiales bacterium]|nr:DNA replication/repair protein RecF [Clostridiales bacterium]
MNVEKITLKNYRNYIDLELFLHPGLNIIYGDNAQGKTNFIESIYICGIGKSHRASKEKELINWNSHSAYIKANIKRANIDTDIEVNIFDNKPKIIKVGGVKIEKISELLGNLNVVMFSPEDLRLIKEGPVYRRRFLDIEVSQIKPAYFYNLHQYNRVLLQRNNLLKSIKYNRSQSLLKTLDIWDEQLSEFGSHIIVYRIEFIKKISMLARLVHRKLTDGKEELNVLYSSMFKNVQTREDGKILLYKELIRSRNRDIERGMTSVGPHRDDMDFFINNTDVKTYGSQGQQRTVALSLKLSELEFIRAECIEYPILLLDDVLSELDIKRQKFLLENLKNVQTILTCTGINDIREFRKNDRFLFKVSDGLIEKIE